MRFMVKMPSPAPVKDVPGASMKITRRIDEEQDELLDVIDAPDPENAQKNWR